MFNIAYLKKFIVTIIIFVLLGVSSSCTKDTRLSTNDGEAEPTPREDIADLSDGRLDGKDDADFDEEHKKNEFVVPKKGVRPFAVMIDNQGDRVLPQGGLCKAQLIYEAIVEGGITRYMPVFWGQESELIGPVRSARHYFLDYAMEHDAIYVHIGYSPMAMNDIINLGVNNINGAPGVFWDLTDDPANWQDSYTSTERLGDYISKAKYRTETEKGMVFKYSSENLELANSQKAEKISLTYSQEYISSYIYDPKTGLYQRSRQGKPHMERMTGEQITAKNIIIQKVENYNIKGDECGRQDLNTVGRGEGYFITNGRCIEITWSKDSRTDRTKYTDKGEKEIVLNKGQTWVQIFPVYGKLDIQ